MTPDVPCPPSLPTLLVLPLVAMVAGWGRSVSGQCTEGEVKAAVHRCYADRSYINTAVLHSTPGSYRQVCRTFSRYILCVDPVVTGCPSRLLRPYWTVRRTYTAPPYNCTLPTFPPAQAYPRSPSYSQSNVTYSHTSVAATWTLERATVSLVLVIWAVVLLPDWLMRSRGAWTSDQESLSGRRLFGTALIDKG